MNAHDFIAELFARPQIRVSANECRLTRAQLDLLVRLIGEDEEGGAVKNGFAGSFTWLPSGRNKYVVTVHAGGDRAVLARLSNLKPSDAGRLF